ncbi:hypothetical protein [Haloprofundus halophilus]
MADTEGGFKFANAYATVAVRDESECFVPGVVSERREELDICGEF